jgi:hypothetical protein
MLRNEFSDHLSMLGNGDRIPIFLDLIDQTKAFGFELSDGNGHKMTSNFYWSLSQQLILFKAIKSNPIPANLAIDSAPAS